MRLLGITKNGKAVVRVSQVELEALASACEVAAETYRRWQRAEMADYLRFLNDRISTALTGGRVRPPAELRRRTAPFKAPGRPKERHL